MEYIILLIKNLYCRDFHSYSQKCVEQQVVASNDVWWDKTDYKEIKKYETSEIFL